MNALSPFERIRKLNPAGHEFWSSREFAQVLNYTDYRNFEAVIEKARAACLNSDHRIEDHFVDTTDMIEIGKGGKRALRSLMMSHYAFYLIIQNADPATEVVALGGAMPVNLLSAESVKKLEARPKKFLRNQ